ncbi:AraC family transcriptional regulator [Actinocatenispora rupis]|uniref:AraC family transcriptional regulator n=1 Tax=Actinocatenispora rupis TaxID=519421 RepID=A0A8J3NAS9_9ACTN|nr:AraC family transcriptional regulator [Actinocatenispora rupis]GID12679.1 AraC family transcriptional regulator [Actinocatenispora rupis]
MTATDSVLSAEPLGQALHFLRLSGTFYCHAELTEPWGVTVPATPDYLWFHIVTAGQGLLEVDGAGVQTLRPGELALVPHGRGHRLRSEPGVAAPNVVELPHEYFGDRYAVLRHGGGDAPGTLVCGGVRFDHPAARELVALLPRLLHLDASRGTEAEWLQATLRLIAAEATTLRPGGETVITRLSDILVVQAIRSWIENDPAAQTGWLGALRDPQIGQAISLIHRHPARPWTLASLAAEVTMSRSAFAARFTQTAGEPVMAYLTRWRMHLARQQLLDGAAVGELAGRLGYHSIAAFSRAFKRVHGTPPSTVRQHTEPAGIPSP